MERHPNSGEAGSEQRPPPRRISRRIGLPSGRAVAGALLVTFAVVGLFAGFRRSQAETTTPYVVLARPVPSGAVIGADDIVVQSLELGQIGQLTLTDPAQAVGAVAIQPLVPGQLLQAGNILEPGAATIDTTTTVEMSFAIDRARALNGSLSPGEVVDVVATIDLQGDACSLVVAPKARVVSVRGAGDDVISSSRDIVLTLALEHDQAVLGVVFAVDESELTIVRSTRSQADLIEGTFCGEVSPLSPDDVAPAAPTGSD